MKKELLLSLIAAGAVPTAALANIDVTSNTGINDATKWVNNGLGSVDASGDLLAGGSIVVEGASAGNLTYTIKGTDIPVGNYKITAEGENFKLSINNKETAEFKHDGKTDVVVKVEGKELGKYSITKLQLDIVVDFAEIKAALLALTADDKATTIGTALTKITAVNYMEGEGKDAKPIDGRQYAEGLAENAKALSETIAALNAKLALLDEEETLETYMNEDLKLWNNPSDLKNEVQAVVNRLAAHNANVTDKNTKSANWKSNQETKEEWDTYAGNLKKAVDGYNAGEIDAWVEGEMAAANEAFTKAYNAFVEALSIYDTDDALTPSTEKDEDGNIILNDYDKIVAANADLPKKADAVNTAKTSAQADLDAYNKIEGYIDAIKKAYTSNYNYFMGLTGKQGSDWAAELTKIKDDALAAIGENAKKGAAAKEPAANTTSAKAVKDLNDKKTDVEGKVNASNTAYDTQTKSLATSKTNLKALQAEIDKVPGEDLFPGKKSALQAEYDRIAKLIDDAEANANSQKEEYACAPDGITGDIATINTAISALKGNIETAQGTAGDWTTNKTALDSLKSRLDDAQEKLQEIDKKTGYKITEKFVVAYDSVDEAITTAKNNNDENLKNNGVTGYEVKPVEIAYVTKGVTEYEEKAIPTAAAFDTKYQAYKDLTTALKALNSQVNDANVLEDKEGALMKTYSDKWGGYAASIETIKTGMDAAADLTADALYQAVNAVSANPDGVEGAIAGDVKAFAAALTTGNMAKLSAKAKAYNDELTAGDADAVFGPGLASVKALMDTKAAVPAQGEEGKDGYVPAQPEVKGYTAKVEDKAKEVNAVSDVTAGYQALDNSIVELYNELIEKVGGAMKAAKDNVAAKAAYEDSDLLIEIAGLEQWVKDNTSEPATTPWLGTGDYEAIGKGKTDLDKTIGELYKENKLTEESAADAKDELQGKVDAFKEKVTANEDAHNKQVEYSEAAIAEVLKAINDVETSGYSEDVTFTLTISGEEKKMTLTEVKDALADLQKGLMPLNKQVYDNYAGLKSTDENIYKELLGQVAEYVDGIASDYYRAVKEANQTTADKAMDGQYSSLATAYQNAVKLYNNISAKNQGDEYNAYVGELLGNGGKVDANYGHAVLQQHYVVLTELDGKINEILEKALPKLGEDNAVVEGTETTDYHVLDASAFNGVKGEVKVAYTDMDNYIKGLTKDVDTYAQKYLGGKFTAAQNVLETADGYMQTACMSEGQITEALLEANNHFISAQAYIYTSESGVVEDEDGTTSAVVGGIIPSDDVKSGDVDKYITQMNAALSELAKVTVDTKGAINNYWTAKFNEADALMAGYKKEITDRESACLASDFAEVLDKYNAAYKAIYGYSASWGFANGIKQNADNTLYYDGVDVIASNIGVYSKQLDEQIANAKEAVSMSLAAVKKNFENSSSLGNFKNNLGEVREGLATLHEKVGNLGLTFDEFQTINVLSADVAVNAFADMLVDDEGKDITNAHDNCKAIKAKLDAATTAIKDVYTRAYNAEIVYLNKIHTQVLGDFNNKYAEVGKDTEELTAWDTAIKAQKALIDAAPNHGVEGKTITPAQQLDALVGIEKALLAIQQEMGVSDSSNAQATDVAVGKLNGINNGVQDCIDALNKELNTLENTLDEEVLAGWRHNTVPAAAYDVQKELDEIVSAYKADKSVETSYSYYVGLLNALKAKVGTDTGKGYRNDVCILQSQASTELNKRNISNSWADQLAAEIAAVEDYYNNILTDISNYEKLFGDYQIQEDAINGEIEYDEYGNIVKGGLIARANVKIANARAGFSLNNSNTHIDQHWDSELKKWVDNDYITNSLYDLNGIYDAIDALALAAAQDETAGWRNEAETELNIASSAVFAGKHVNQVELESELTELWNTWNENRKVSSEVTECARQKMTFKGLIAQAQALVTLAEENFYTPGDLNEDRKVTTTDFVALVDIILGKEEVPTDPVIFAAADLNEDKEIGVGDAVKEMRIINRLDNVSAAPRRGTVECSASLAQGLLNINNNIAIASVMVDVKGVSASDIALSSRAAGMQLMTNTLANGTVRVVVIATDGTTLAGNEGAVLNIAGNATLVKVVAADTMGNEYTVVNNGEATAIESITNAIKTAGQKIYSVGGQMMNTLKKGINIIRNADGTSTKVTKK